VEVAVIAIDPGNAESAFVRYQDGRPLAFGKRPNAEILAALPEQLRHEIRFGESHLAIEMIASYGMPVGAEIFETCVWIGRFVQAWGAGHSLIYRRDVKLHLCGQARAKDGNVRQALLDRWGGRAKAIGTKAKPGPLYGFKADLWQALAVAVTYSDRQTQTVVSSNPIASGEVSA
jgi:hypothetical protein